VVVARGGGWFSLALRVGGSAQLGGVTAEETMRCGEANPVRMLAPKAVQAWHPAPGKHDNIYRDDSYPCLISMTSILSREINALPKIRAFRFLPRTFFRDTFAALSLLITEIGSIETSTFRFEIAR
jgi:hypothetical protein